MQLRQQYDWETQSLPPLQYFTIWACIFVQQNKHDVTEWGFDHGNQANKQAHVI